MKNFKTLLSIAFIATALFLTSCSKDDDTVPISVQDLVVTIDENPTNGQAVGTVQTEGTGVASGFSITSQTPAGALSIDSNTGELTVADATLFDFETNPVITATISVVDAVNTGTATVTIDLNDLNELGEFKFGGVVFWINPSDNSQGLVCALDNQMSAPWGCSGVATGATGTAIGTGEANTATIVSAGCATGGALEIVSNLNLNGYDDWFLPSIDEMNEIRVNYLTYILPTIQANGGSAFFSSVWTSTEVSSVNALIAFLGGSSPLPFDKAVDAAKILPIRSF